MGYLSVLVAATAAYGFGAIWYKWFGRFWAKAAGIERNAEGKPIGASPWPFMVGAIAVIVVAGMMRHVFLTAGLRTLGEGLMGGFGLGAFVVFPWILMNYAYAKRPLTLTLIDGANAIIGCTVIGVVLTIFI